MMRYAFSIATHYLTGKLTARDALHALRRRPIAVASKGKVWIVDPAFAVGD